MRGEGLSSNGSVSQRLVRIADAARSNFGKCPHHDGGGLQLALVKLPYC